MEQGQDPQTNPIDPAAETATAAATTEAPAAAETAAAQPDPAALIADLEAQLDAERARANDLLEKYQRMSAEFQNARRRQEKQMAEEIERANAHMIKRLLPVVDDFDLAFANVPADLSAGAAWVEGFRQIHKKLHALLEEEGVVAIPPDGEFDPTLHDAILSEPGGDVPAGYLIATLRTGYTHRGRTLRPAMVRVAE